MGSDAPMAALTLQTMRSSSSRRYKSGTVRGRPDRRPIAVSKSTGLRVRVTRPPIFRMTQPWNGEITLPITQTPARVPPILLSTGALIAVGRLAWFAGNA